MTLPQKAVVLARILLNAPLPSLPVALAGLAITQLWICSGVPGLSFLNLRPSELTLVLGLPLFPGVLGNGGTTSTPGTVPTSTTTTTTKATSTTTTTQPTTTTVSSGSCAGVPAWANNVAVRLCSLALPSSEAD